jgi:ferredoxin
VVRAQIVADLDRCIGSGQCVLTDPAVFDQSDEDGVVELLREHPEGEAELARVREAVALCPGRALSVRDR